MNDGTPYYRWMVSNNRRTVNIDTKIKIFFKKIILK